MLVIYIVGAAAIVLIISLIVRNRNRSEIKAHSIGVDELHAMVEAKRPVLVYDVRQPLDLLTQTEIIPGATRIPPREIEENPELIPRDQDVVVYCTCPSDKTSLSIWRRAQAAGFTRVKFLKGGLDVWKEKGYPVEKYTESFQLDSGA